MATPLKIPEVGRYRILRELGRGAMGTVYLAEDPVIGRRVALKVLRLDLPGADESSERIRAQFQAEVQSAGILSHPNIVTVYDAIEETDDGALCIAMEYVEGTTLAEILKRPEPIAVDTALEIGAQVADALDYAHGKGVIHRDIKPANVIVTADGQAKITDFGIAHLIDAALSDDLRFLGTPSYMAPERIEGEEIDHRADLFSLGIILYQLLTRHMPFQGSSVADLTRSIARDEPAPPERFAPELREDLRSVLNKSLEKKPSKRYQDAAALANDLRGVLATFAAQHSTQPLTPSSAVALAGERSERPWLRWFATAAVVTALAAAGTIWLAGRSQPAATAAAAASEASAPAHVATMSEGIDRLRNGDFAAAADLLRSAELLEPRSERASLWRSLAEERLARDQAALAELDLLALIEEGREALASGRWARARERLDQASDLDPDHLLVADLRSRIYLAQQQRRERQEAAVAAAAVVERPPPPVEVEPQVVEVPPAPVARTGTVELDFFSRAPRGVLTIYDGDEQIYRQPFRFVERRRFLPPKPATGSLSSTWEMPTGPVELRLYLALPNRATQVLPVRGRVEGGARSILRLRVDTDGRFTAEWR